jgi:lauroyl/myristoyl acyltransferase
MDIIDYFIEIIEQYQSLIELFIYLYENPNVDKSINFDKIKYSKIYLECIKTALLIGYGKSEEIIEYPSNFDELLTDMNENGVIFITGHFGYYLAIPHILDNYLKKQLTLVIYKKILYNTLQFCLSLKKQTNFKQSNLEIINQTDSYNHLLRQLLDKNNIYLAIDTSTKKETTEQHTFMGRKKYYYDGSSRLHNETKKSVWSIFLYRDSDKKLKLSINKINSDIMKNFFTQLEILVTKFPEQYILWNHHNTT